MEYILFRQKHINMARSKSTNCISDVYIPLCCSYLPVIQCEKCLKVINAPKNILYFFVIYFSYKLHTEQIKKKKKLLELEELKKNLNKYLNRNNKRIYNTLKLKRI